MAGANRAPTFRSFKNHGSKAQRFATKNLTWQNERSFMMNEEYTTETLGLQRIVKQKRINE